MLHNICRIAINVSALFYFIAACYIQFFDNYAYVESSLTLRIFPVLGW